jgi:hypothetical protein
MNIISAHSPAYLADSSISLMVTFEGAGELPFCATPNDTEAYGRELYDRAVAGGEFGPITPYVEPVPTSAQIIDSISSAVQGLLDSTAKSRGYDNIVSACSYAGASNPFQAEGQAFVSWRGAVWSACYAIMADVKSGIRPVPDADELIAELPVLSLA